MAAFLSNDWFAAVRADDVDLADVLIESTVTGAPGSDVRWHVQVRGGTVTAEAGGVPDADVALTSTYDVAVAILRGDLAPSVAFMQGRMKTAGDPGKLLELLRSTAGPGYEAFRDAVAATTTFS